MSLLEEVLGRVDLERIKGNMRDLSGGPENSRLAYTEGEEEAHEKLMAYINERGFNRHQDLVGNTFGIIGDDEHPSVLIGSHLDNIGSGMVDGVLGVAIGLEALECLNPSIEQLKNRYVVAAFRQEESVRWGTSLFGSRAIFRDLPDEVFDREDKNKVTMIEAMNALGHDPPNGKSIEDFDVYLMIEPHTEQGPLLYDRGLDVGIVTGIAGPHRYELRFHGQQHHTGTMPAKYRHDAFLAICDANVALDRYLRSLQEELGPNELFYATINDTGPLNRSFNVVSGEHSAKLDIRMSHPKMREYRDQIFGLIKGAKNRHGVKMGLVAIEEKEPVVSMNPGIVSMAEEQARGLGISYEKMPSGPNHDAATFYHNGVGSLVLFGDSIGGHAHEHREQISDSSIESLAKLTIACALGGGK